MNNNDKKRARYLAVSITFLIAAVILGLSAAGYKLKRLRTLNHQPALRDEAEEAEEEKVNIWNGIVVPDKGIDWAALKLQNADIFAWIYIPGTRVDYPVLRSAGDPYFYYSHAEEGESSENGAIFAGGDFRGFSLSNMVVYGRELSDGSRFSTLSYYEDADFFDRSPYIFVYTPLKTYIFEIFAAYRYGEVPLETEFGAKEDFTAYIESVFGQKDLNSNFRRDTKTALNEEARVLSCASLGGPEDIRYVVQAVLLNGGDQ
ncbi:MAG TPA: hypothetical protein DCL38_04995 [Lachnospiraceae bacterium]|nr:hypothetical protein [Lachnospiraceae bacterium]